MDLPIRSTVATERYQLWRLSSYPSGNVQLAISNSWRSPEVGIVFPSRHGHWVSSACRPVRVLLGEIEASARQGILQVSRERLLNGLRIIWLVGVLKASASLWRSFEPCMM